MQKAYDKYKERNDRIVIFTFSAVRLLQIARGVHIYFLAKLTELLDTVFFVLRKKDKQITFLHMYHHTVMPMISWGATKYFPGGQGIFIGMWSRKYNYVPYRYLTLPTIKVIFFTFKCR